jgi:GPH family glycoside/pentoside/hexuronide:cation symporter
VTSALIDDSSDDHRRLEPLPKRVVFALSAGQGAMSILINLIGILLVFFYLPPAEEDLPTLVTRREFWIGFNAVALIAAGGRLLDAVTDPAIAMISDRSTHRKGRRISLMRIGGLPAVIATVLLFVPPVQEQSAWNIVWLVGVQIVLYIALTAYVTPCFALVADLGRTPAERLDLVTWTSVAWALGIVIASLATPLSAGFEAAGFTGLQSWQASVFVVAAIALVGMYLPVWMIDEPRYARSAPTSVSLRESLSVVFANPFFRYYVAADFSYFCGLAIIQTGILFYVTVLLELDKALVAPLLGLMVIMALVLYPIVNKQAKKRSGKQMVVGSFLMTATMFFGIVFLGMYPIPPIAQAAAIVIFFSVPFSVLSVLPQWILSDIAEHSLLSEGDATTGMFFGARTFAQKIGQTLGIVIFAVFLSFGGDVGDDLGIRLSGVGGLVLYSIAALIFSRYDESRLRTELAGLSAQVNAGRSGGVT